MFPSKASATVGVILVSLFFLVSCEKFKPQIDSRELLSGSTSQRGTIIKILYMKSAYLELPRNLYIYLPHGYDKEPVSYPAIYFNDGRTLFSGFSKPEQNWKMEALLDALIEKKEIPKVIVVGIGNTLHRTAEYQPYPVASPKEKENPHPVADKYLDFIRYELVPYIEGNYRVLRSPSMRTIAGSSYGGTFALYAVLKAPETFGKALTFSPSLWPGRGFLYGGERILKDYSSSDLNPNMKIYADIGGNEGHLGYPRNTLLRFNSILNRKLKNENVLSVYDPAGHHAVKDWVNRFPDAVKWILE